MIPHDPATRRYQFIDAGPVAPRRSTDAGKTVWYTVRAVQDTACGQLQSGDSAPAWGVLREREGPPAPSGTLTLSQFCPQIVGFNAATEPFDGADLSAFYGTRSTDTTGFKAVITRLSEEIETVSISTCTEADPGETTVPVLVVTKHFPTGIDTVEIGAILKVNDWLTTGVVLTVTDSRGKSISVKQPLEIYEPTSLAYRRFNLTVDQREVTSTITDGMLDAGGSAVHDPVANDGSGSLNPVAIDFLFVDPAREFKLYKRIDSGPLILVRQGTDEEFPTSATVALELEDGNLPANAAEVCYFLQVFDRHGNPSPLALLGCFRTTPRAPLVAPMITTITTAGSMGSPTATINWFCPPDGVDRFYVYLADGECAARPELRPRAKPRDRDAVHRPRPPTDRPEHRAGGAPRGTPRRQVLCPTQNRADQWIARRSHEPGCLHGNNPDRRRHRLLCLHPCRHGDRRDRPGEFGPRVQLVARR